MDVHDTRHVVELFDRHRVGNRSRNALEDSLALADFDGAATAQ